jgi:predicted kinase
MSCITFTVGPPGAGKSRWAHQQVAERGLHAVQRVNLDDFLTMTHGRAFGEITASDLKLTKRMLISTVRTIAESGRDVIVDNTHLSTRFPNLVRDELGDGFEYEIKDFTVVPLADCIEQDAVRSRLDPGGHVGEEEVTRMWHKAQSLQRRFGGPGLPDWTEDLNRSDGIVRYKPDPSLPKALIVDIDGTLALANSRGPYDTSRYHTDDLEARLKQMINDLARAYEPYQILVLTGRESTFRDVLEEWLETHHVLWDEIHMRPEGDSRRDNVVKLDLFNTYVRDRFNVIATFDDRDRVVRLWRRLGLLTCQVNWGDF